MASSPRADFSRTQPPDLAWLGKAVAEEPLNPDIPIIDVHMHLWHHATGYRYFVEEHAADIAASGRCIEATVYIECGQFYRADGSTDLRSVGETQYAAGMAAIAESGKYGPTRIAGGIIANADLTLDSARLEEVLDAHEAAANGRLRGIRRSAKWDADPVVSSGKVADRPGILTEPQFQAGVSMLAARALIYEATIFHPQIRDVADLARAAPETTLVVNHCGSPLGYGGYRGREDEVHRQWLADMRELATCPNVTIKLGGMLMSLANFDFKAAERPPTSGELAELWRPYIEHCVELFGTQRCMLASNFPVEKAGIAYPAIWNMFMRVFSGCSNEELVRLCSGTARHVYRF